MIAVEYIGRKPIKTDNVANSPTVWHGPGDVQQVTPEVWAKLKPFDTVWREVAAPAQDHDAEKVNRLTISEQQPDQQAEQTEAKADGFEYVLQQDGQPDVVLDTMDLEALKAFNATHSLGVDMRIRNVERFRKAVFEAATKPAEAQAD
jgi:hypothetical protein